MDPEEERRQLEGELADLEREQAALVRAARDDDTTLERLRSISDKRKALSRRLMLLAARGGRLCLA